jgi:hypothetical protein
MSRNAPPVHVLVDRFTVWIAAWVLLWVLAACSLAVWVAGWAHPATVALADRAHWLALIVLGFVLLAGLWRSRLSAVSLRWDGEQWWLGTPGEVGVEPWPVQPSVRLDLGTFMLLQLEPRAGVPGQSIRYRWLPIQRWGLATQWHGLRCALLTYPEQQRGLS